MDNVAHPKKVTNEINQPIYSRNDQSFKRNLNEEKSFIEVHLSSLLTSLQP